jgi:CO/xanthine dehydrogenase Mo-binding subunit
MARELRGRLVSAVAAGYGIGDEDYRLISLPDGVHLLREQDFLEDLPLVLAEPFGSVTVLPDRAVYPGEPIAVLLGTRWADLDRIVPRLPQSPPPEDELPAISAPEDPVWSESISTEDETAPAGSPDEAPPDQPQQIAEGTYSTAMQLHMADAPLWARAEVSEDSARIAVTAHWPALVRNSVALALGVPARTVELSVSSPSGSRDAALWMSAYLAVLAALIARREKTAVTIALSARQRHLTGGRSPASIRWSSRLDEEGFLTGNRVTAVIDAGAYPTLVEETGRRLRHTVESLYRVASLEYTATMHRSAAVPSGAFEGVGSAQLAFAREVHYSRLAGLAEEDPILWRQRHLRSDWPVLQELLGSLAEESDFHRRYAANELVRKRRLQLPRNSSSLKGIGCAVAEQLSGMTGDREFGAVTVRLDQGGTATLFCTLPTPSTRLITSWRQIVAQELGLDLDDVAFDATFEGDLSESGPRLFSRGVSVIPRTITSICQAIQKQRFRAPLPIQVRRTIKPSKGSRTPAHALRSAGAAAVEVVLLPSSMEIEVKSVTLAVYAGKILDRAMAEAELRRGVYQALNWGLHEAIRRPAEMGAFLDEEPHATTYITAFRGKPPRIRIIFGTAERKDGPTGIGELPFLTVPAALTSALSQASGLYLDSLPARPATLLQMLQED